MNGSGPVLVTGATGTQGGAVVDRLLADGRAVRALVRDATAPAALALAARGVGIATGDFDEPSTLEPALAGVESVFLMPPVAYGPGGTDVEREFARGKAFVDAAVRADVEQVVFSGVASVSKRVDGTDGKQRVETHLRERIPLVTALRPVRFMTNYLAVTPMGIDGIADGVHRHLFPPDEPMQIVAPEDIADFAALAFADPARFAGRTVELAGDEPTPVEAAATISAAVGVPVRYEQITDDEAAAMGPEIAKVRQRWTAGERWHADVEVLRIVHPGLRTLGDWLAESGAARLEAALAGRR